MRVKKYCSEEQRKDAMKLKEKRTPEQNKKALERSIRKFRDSDGKRGEALRKIAPHGNGGRKEGAK